MKNALFTVSFAGFWGQRALSLEESIAKTADLGFEYIELMGKRPHLSALDYSPADCEKLAKTIRRAGLKVAAVAAYTDFGAAWDAREVPFTEMQVAHVEALAIRAALFDAPLVRIFSAYERPAVPFGEQWQATVRAVRECCVRAGTHGVSVGLQNHHDIGVDSKSMAEFVRQVDQPNLVPLVDCWSLHLRGEPLDRAVARFANRLEFTTVADYAVLPRARYQPGLVNYQAAEPAYSMAVPMGEGDLDYTRFFDAMRANGFDGVVSYEMCSPLRDGGSLETLERYAKTFLRYMEQRG